MKVSTKNTIKAVFGAILLIGSFGNLKSLANINDPESLGFAIGTAVIVVVSLWLLISGIKGIREKKRIN